MFHRILVPLDGSKNAERAIPVAAHLARASAGSITFVRVVLPPPDFRNYAKQHSKAWERAAYEKHHAQAATYLVGMLLKYENDLAGMDVELEIATGITIQAICSAAQLDRADLIVLCSHEESRMQRWLFGSVTQGVAQHCHVPVLVLHEHGSLLPALRGTRPVCALVALDGSPSSEAALAPAITFLSTFVGQATGALHLLRVIDHPATEGKLRSQAHSDPTLQEQARREAEVYLQTVIDRLYEENAEARRLTITSSVIRSTDRVGTIAQQAACIEGFEDIGGCDLIVIADHERNGIERLVKGSITKNVLRATQLPLMLVQSQKTHSHSRTV